MFVGVRMSLCSVGGPVLIPSTCLPPDGRFLRVEVCSMLRSSLRRLNPRIRRFYRPSVLTPPPLFSPFTLVLFVPMVGVRNYLKTIVQSRGNYVDTISLFPMSVM